MSVQFNIHAADSAAVSRLVAELHIPRFIAATLVSRGLTSPQEARCFLEPSLDKDWHNPYDIPGLSDVADALEAAIKRDDRILVFGDFDLDGMSAACVLTRGLREIGAVATPFIPLRFEEGYGLTQAAIDRACLIDPPPDFIVTVDCGIACKVEAAYVRSKGIGLAITDHHEAADLVPEDVPVADPKMDAGCKSAILAGVGVALKLLQALGGRFGRPHLWREYIDLATLGTIADLMPMRGENRALVSEGIVLINEHPRACLRALLEISGAAGKPVSATNVSFSIIPRLNAAGRMGDAQTALDLLMEDDFERALLLAEKLEALNDQRRSIESELFEIAQIKAREIYTSQRALVVAGENFHEGVKGIVASRLVGIYGVPVVLFTIKGDEARGSGRSIGQVSLFKAVESTSDLLIKFGGHDAAVGITLPAKNLDAFFARLCAYMDTLPDVAFHPPIDIDACTTLDEFSLDAVKRLDLLAPFGQENPVPTYLARDVTLLNCRAVGAEKNHFSCQLSDGRAVISGIMFHCADIASLLYNDSVVHVAFQASVDTWRGQESVKAHIKILAPSHTCGALEACLDPFDQSFVSDLYAAEHADLSTDDIVFPTDSKYSERRAQWEDYAKNFPDTLEKAIVEEVIGQKELHPAQRSVLDVLSQHKSVLAIMATGRGKSLTFQVHAALCALKDHSFSILVYPLRALIADQAYHLQAFLEPFGVRSCVITGETSFQDRRRIFCELSDGLIDIVLTTPEFLAFHTSEFAACKKCGFLVVDEAHHIARAHAGYRSAYAQLTPILHDLGDPHVLACTATADDAVADRIGSTLGIDKVVIDETSRENLLIDDRRNLKNRDDYLASLIAGGEKCVVYVNSRMESLNLARSLRKRVPQVAPMIGFYNAGLSRSERSRIENLFRSGSLVVLITTSAFGEGIDIPDVRHVVLYHLPYNEIEFNQMSGRAGRDGDAATIHLLFNSNDASLNERLLCAMTPQRDVLAQVYRWLIQLQNSCPNEFFPLAGAGNFCEEKLRGHKLQPSVIECGIAVFSELGLIETHTSSIEGEDVELIRVVDDHPRVELTDSVRYREGLDEQDTFRDFRSWAFSGSANDFLQRISRPIAPVHQQVSSGV